MATGSLIYRLSVDVSNIDENLYTSLPLHLAQHPSEDKHRLVARALTFCLLYESGLTFGKGLDEPDEPALYVRDDTRELRHWIDVGTPNADRLHRASKACPALSVFCHRGTAGLLRERGRRKIFAAEKIQVWTVTPQLIDDLAEATQRNSHWAVIRTGLDLMLTVDETSLHGEISITSLNDLT